MLTEKPLSCGQGHVALVKKGVLYTWGKSSHGRLGTEDNEAEYQPPLPVLTLIRLQVNVVSVSCGALHTLALTNFGVFSWGSSQFGQLGLEDVQQAIQPRIVESLLKENITDVCCGQYHSMALTEEGRVLSWGWGIHGQLGHGNAEDVPQPKMIESLRRKRMIAISAGQGHSVLLTRNGDVYTFGCGLFGQLGSGSVSKLSRPQMVNIPERIKLISSGYFHVVAVSRVNKVYTWGCNPQALRLQAQNSRRMKHHGAAVSNAPAHPRAQPQTHLFPVLVAMPTLTDAIVQVSCGSHHSVLVTSSGHLYSWGRNSEGQIGNGTRKEQKYPTVVASVKDLNISYAVCGADFTIAIDTNGKVIGWGQNDAGQIGHKPCVETSSKNTSGSTSGRVITIRTNRRMITITQPCRQSVLRPLEIHIPQREMNYLDSESFNADHSVRLQIETRSNYSFSDAFADCDKFQYNPKTLHLFLEVLYKHCDSTVLLSHCLNFGNFQAAAKLCSLENAYNRAVEYQLKALEISGNGVDFRLVLSIIEFYSKMVDPENIEINKDFLHRIIEFWMKHKLAVLPLESFFHQHIQKFTFPLSSLLFRNGMEEIAQKSLLASLSTSFCLKLMNRSLSAHSDTTTWDDETIPTDRLWMDILHNVQSGIENQSAIHLSAGDIDMLGKSLTPNHTHSKDSVVFSCGHFETLNAFQTSRLKEIDSVPRTVELILAEYQHDVIGAACPSCTVSEIMNEL